METQRPPFDPNARMTQPVASGAPGIPAHMQPSVPATYLKPTFSTKVKYTFQYARAMQTRPPWLRVSQGLWIVLGGWLLFLGYALAGLVLMLTIVFIPFGLQTLRFAWFAFNPVGKEVYTPRLSERGEKLYERALNDPLHPMTTAVNVIWLVLVGWIFALAHILLGMLNMLTIVGVGNGLQHFRLAWFVLWPFGKQIRNAEPVPWPFIAPRAAPGAVPPMTAAETQMQAGFQGVQPIQPAVAQPVQGETTMNFLDGSGMPATAVPMTMESRRSVQFMSSPVGGIREVRSPVVSVVHLGADEAHVPMQASLHSAMAAGPIRTPRPSAQRSAAMIYARPSSGFMQS